MTNDSGMPDELHIEVTEEDYRTAREMMARSELGHCFRCLKPRPPEGAPRRQGLEHSYLGGSTRRRDISSHMPQLQ